MSPLHAQESAPTQPRPRVVRTNPPVASPPARTRRADQDSPLSQNYMVTVAGSMGEKDAMHVVLCGNSRNFMADLAESSTHVKVTLTEQDDKLLVAYTISSRIEVNMSNGNVQYRDGSVTGSFIATLGKPFTVLQVGKNGLAISVDKSVN